MLFINIKYQLFMNNQLLCPKCGLEYSENNPPKMLINCPQQPPHLICFKCLEQQLICPLQTCRKRIQKRKYTINKFNTHEETLLKIKNKKILSNQSSKKSIQNGSKHIEQLISQTTTSKTKSNQDQKINNHITKKEDEKHPFLFDTCLLHSKVADLICLEDNCLICSNCGLFGEHKKHRLLPYDQFVAQFTKITQQSFKIYQSLKQKENLFKQETILEQINNLLQQKRDKQLKSIKSHILALNNMVKRYQTQLIVNLDTIINFKREKILQGINFQNTLSKKEDFILSIEKMSQGIESILKVQNFEDYLSYLDKESSQGYIINEGEYLVVQIDNLYKNMQHFISNQTQEFGYQFNIKLDLIKDMIKLNSKDIKEVERIIDEKNKPKINRFKPNTPITNTKPKETSPKVKCNNEDPLLIGTNSKSDSKNSNQKEVNNSPLINTLISAFDYSHSPNNSINKKQIMNSSKNKNILRQKSLNKKRRKIDLSEKYLKIYEDLQKDKLDVFDLGGGFLGDNNILQISELFPSRNKLKSVKLMNNKITDEVFPELIYNCKNISSLNLSYNSLTQKSLQWLQKEVDRLGELKNITLSNNKIVLRNVKDRLEYLSHRRIKVSL